MSKADYYKIVPVQALGLDGSLLPSEASQAVRDLICSNIITFFENGAGKALDARINAEAMNQDISIVWVVDKYFRMKWEDKENVHLKVRNEIRPAAKAAQRLEQALQKLPQRAKSTLNIAMRPPTTKEKPLEDLIALLEILRNKSAPFLAVKGTRRGQTSITYACDYFWTMFESITGRDFIRTWTDAPGQRPKSGDAELEFSNIDAQFVLCAMKALDPSVSLGQVRDGLKQAAEARKA